MRIKTITVTGADDSTTHASMIELADKYPCLEFGILVSRRQMGMTRFPCAAWIKKLKELPANVRLSVHICGQWVTDTLLGNPPSEIYDMFGAIKNVKRFQLNTHGVRHAWRKEFIESLHGIPQTVIFQNDGRNDQLIDQARQSGLKNIASLFDLSHGGGFLPETWPMPIPGMKCGYAGGLTPENVHDQCVKIREMINDANAEIWIDAEKHLRSFDYSNQRDTFDMEKVEQFVKAALPFTA